MSDQKQSKGSASTESRPAPVFGFRHGGGPGGMFREVEKSKNTRQNSLAPVGIFAAAALGAGRRGRTGYPYVYCGLVGTLPDG